MGIGAATDVSEIYLQNMGNPIVVVKKKRLTRGDWLSHALEMLKEEGSSGVRVEPLSRSLGVTTGSFYWHFKNREDLHRSLIEHWETDLAVATPEQMFECKGDAKERLLALLKLIVREDLNRYDRAMRAWASSDELVAAAVLRVDQRRLDTALQLFLEMGFDLVEADLRSRVSYYYLVGEQTVLVDTSLKLRMQLAELRCRLLTAGAPGV